MRRWVETREVLNRLAVALHAGMQAALCTVIRVRGSAYRREGAKLLVAGDGSTTGNVAAGCLEHDLREVALEVIRSGRAEVRGYCTSSHEMAPWDLGLGCDGQVDLLIQPASKPQLEERWRFDRRLPFAVATLLPTPFPDQEAKIVRRMFVTATSAEGTLCSETLDAGVGACARELLTAGRSEVREFGDRSVFIESLIPPPQLVLFGAGEDARPLARFAAELGFRVVVADKRPAYLRTEWFPPDVVLVDSRADDLKRRLALDESSYGVVMTHNVSDDRVFVGLLLRSPVTYIGVLGPRQRAARILDGLTQEGVFDESQRTRIYGPVGLDIGTDGAEQVALSILAEVLAVRSGRPAISTRERPTPIHGHSP